MAESALIVAVHTYLGNQNKPASEDDIAHLESGLAELTNKLSTEYGFGESVNKEKYWQIKGKVSRVLDEWLWNYGPELLLCRLNLRERMVRDLKSKTPMVFKERMEKLMHDYLVLKERWLKGDLDSDDYKSLLDGLSEEYRDLGSYARKLASVD